MFIRKRDYKELLARVDNLESALSRMALAQSERQREYDNALGGAVTAFEETSGELEVVRTAVELINEKLAQHDKYIEQTSEYTAEAAKLEMDFLKGLTSISNYGGYKPKM